MGLIKMSDIRILIACMPKSGSTFLSQSIAQIPGFRRERLVRGFERREQELCLVALRKAAEKSQRKRDEFNAELVDDATQKPSRAPIGFVVQQHLRQSKTTARLIDKFDLKPVVLVRNIFDLVLSIQDHYRNLSPAMSMAYVDERIAGMDDSSVQDFIVDMVIPWYINFHVSWQHYDGCLRLSYEQVMADKKAAVLAVLDYAGADARSLEQTVTRSLEKAEAGFTRKNVGKSGRGASISDDNKDRIRRMAAYYPDVDFSSIGL